MLRSILGSLAVDYAGVFLKILQVGQMHSEGSKQLSNHISFGPMSIAQVSHSELLPVTFPLTWNAIYFIKFACPNAIHFT